MTHRVDAPRPTRGVKQLEKSLEEIKVAHVPVRKRPQRTKRSICQPEIVKSVVTEKVPKLPQSKVISKAKVYSA